jgi:ribosomal protein L37AE/L43A
MRKEICPICKRKMNARSLYLAKGINACQTCHNKSNPSYVAGIKHER